MAKSCGVKSRSALYREIFAEPISVNGNATSGVEARKKGLRLFCRTPFSQLVLTAAEDMGFEPTTHCWASDFESDRWPVRLSSSDIGKFTTLVP